MKLEIYRVTKKMELFSNPLKSIKIFDFERMKTEIMPLNKK